jgi:hypothetical protein
MRYPSGGDLKSALIALFALSTVGPAIGGTVTLTYSQETIEPLRRALSPEFPAAAIVDFIP